MTSFKAKDIIEGLKEKPGVKKEEIAEPKLKVEAKNEFPVKAEVPSFYGFKKEIVNATPYDKEKEE